MPGRDRAARCPDWFARYLSGTLLVYDLDVTTATGQLEQWRGLQLRVVDATRQQPRAASGFRRPDGKPEPNGRHASASHAGSLVMTVASGTLTSCDMEPVAARPPAMWRDLAGPERCALPDLIARETGEDLDTAATRVWCAIECLKKAGAMHDRPLVFKTCYPDGWIELAAGAARILTCTAAVESAENRLVFAVLSES